MALPQELIHRVAQYWRRLLDTHTTYSEIIAGEYFCSYVDLYIVAGDAEEDLNGFPRVKLWPRTAWRCTLQGIEVCDDIPDAKATGGGFYSRATLLLCKRHAGHLWSSRTKDVKGAVL